MSFFLVCKDYSSIGQALLWKNVVLVTETQGKKCLASGKFGCYKTKSLGIRGGVCDGVLKRTAERVLNGMKGLRVLEVLAF